MSIKHIEEKATCPEIFRVGRKERGLYVEYKREIHTIESSAFLEAELLNKRDGIVVENETKGWFVLKYGRPITIG